LKCGWFVSAVGEEIQKSHDIEVGDTNIASDLGIHELFHLSPADMDGRSFIADGFLAFFNPTAGVLDSGIDILCRDRD
jgi:hypothetical protein